MGCDIHMYVEVRGEGGVWRMVRPEPAKEINPGDPWGDPPWRCVLDDGEDGWEWFETRNYDLFGVLSGVRRDVRHTVATPGIPSDVSDRFRDEFHNWGGHTPCYMTLWDWDNAYEWCSGMSQHAAGPTHDLSVSTHWLSFLAEIRPLHSDPRNIRMVFFYDN